MDHPSGPVLAEPGKFLNLALLLLTWRGCHLQATVYNVLTKKQDAVKQLVLIGAATSYLTKLASMRSGSAKDLKGRRKFVLLQDEYMNEPTEREAVNLLEFEAALLAGDPHQSVARRPQLSPEGASLKTLGTRLEQPVQWHPALTWLEHHPHVNKVVNTETFRTGQPAIGHLQTIFGEELRECVSAAAQRTWLIPVLFGRVSDWQTHESTECQTSLTVFTSIAVVLAAETLSALRTGRRSSLVVTGFLLRPLRALEGLLKVVVPPLCVAAQSMVGLTAVTVEQVLNHMADWQFRGPYSVGGANADVAVCLGVRRQKDDQAWRGLALEKPLVYTSLTRAKRRAYLFVEDLRDEVTLPSRGVEKKAGEALGLRKYAAYGTISGHILWTRVVVTCVNITQADFQSRVWWTYRPEIPWLFWCDQWRTLLGLSNTLLPADAVSTLATQFRSMNWPAEEMSPEPIAATYFDRFTLPPFKMESRPRPSTERMVARLVNRPTQELTQRFWSALRIDNLTVCYGVRDATIQVPVMAYMSVKTWAEHLLPNALDTVRAAVTDPNYMAEVLT